MDKSNYHIRVYYDLINSEKLRLYWKGDDYIPAHVISENDQQIMNDLCCVEYMLEGVGSHRDKIPKLFDDFESFVKRFILKQNHGSYYISVSDKGVKSKIRSYKGIFPKGQLRDGSITMEHELDDSYSIFLTMTPLIDPFIDIILRQMYATFSSFLITPYRNKEIFNEAFLKSVVENVNAEGSLSYRKLLINYCPDNCVIHRINGMNPDLEILLQSFGKKDLQKEIVFNMEKALFL